jgi:3'-phosphoadenosine 5'-phosphosulfate sulfotransferase (PAPS reductase)/FAD synthetase
MAVVFDQTIKRLVRLAKEHDSILVSYSGGKDSLCVMDLCCSLFARVEAFHMFFVPGLAHVEERLEYARQRWKIDIRQYPHWGMLQCLKHGTYRFPDPAFASMPDLNVHDIERLALSDAKCSIVAHGGKMSDSLWRRRTMKALSKSHQERIYPIEKWNKWHVLAYLQSKKIPVPSSDGATSGGLGLTVSSVLWLYDSFPEDYEKIRLVYPFVEAIVKRRDWYGIGTHAAAKDRARPVQAD